MPSAPASRSAAAPSPLSASESTQSISIAAAVAEARVAQRLGDRQVGVLELDVLADDRDAHALASARAARSTSSRQSSSSAGGASIAEVLEDELVDALVVEGERALVDVRDVVGGHDRLDRQAREQRDLLADVAPSSGDSERHTSMSGWMPIRRSSLTECCVGFVFSSPAWLM